MTHVLGRRHTYFYSPIDSLVLLGIWEVDANCMFWTFHPPISRDKSQSPAQLSSVTAALLCFITDVDINCDGYTFFSSVVSITNCDTGHWSFLKILLNKTAQCNLKHTNSVLIYSWSVIAISGSFIIRIQNIPPWLVTLIIWLPLITALLDCSLQLRAHCAYCN